ncbi:inactive peptidyl-prolyl cis-trans isomerase FKBP6-like [Styela clava]|uniref:inactive peptidyl-prolyl cis-trans isomerase FKBP6-like n=1 Tax=Styela clava TaxID=7725 RepID=UPI00193ABB34|nr:inactive peptidyl-prolyl cis-trans isomerase FKBP6-like [Styela clava]
MAEKRNNDDPIDNLPKYGIFGPTKPVKHGVCVSDLREAGHEGAVLEFCTDEISENVDERIQQEDKYFDSPDMSKCSYILEELCAASDDDESVPMFDRLKAKMKNVTEDGGVKKAILSEGVGGVVPADSRIRAHYHAFLEDMSEPYDSSYLQGKELKITLGKGLVIPGLDLGIASMRKKEKSRFLVCPEYAYGEMGCPPRIPSNATILFEVELLGFTESSILDECEGMNYNRQEFTFSKMLEVAKAEKNEGNDLFHQKQYIKAQHKFMRCINAMESVRLKDENEEVEMIKIVSKSYQNMALCCLRLGNFGKALAAGRRVLEYDPDHAKALFIVGKALRHIGDFKEARKYMLRARKFAPTSDDITKELKLIDKTEERFRNAEVGMYKKMFSGHVNVTQNGIPTPRTKVTSTKQQQGIAMSSFQSVIKGRLEDFKKNNAILELGIPISAFTQHEILCAANTAEEMRLDVELIDKPGKPKQLKITKPKFQ